MSDQDADEPNLYEYLKGVDEVAQLVGDRIYAGRIPQHNFETDGRHQDCVVYQRVGAVRGVGFCSSDGLVSGSYQIDCYSPDDVAMVKVARAIRRALVDYFGPMGAVQVCRVLLDNEFDSQEPEPGLNRRTQTFTIWYAEGG